MLSEKTIHQFLNSASVNMSKADYGALATQLKGMPGLADAVTSACGQIRTKQRNQLERKVSAKLHLADPIETAKAATYRALDVHSRAQERLRRKVEASENAEWRRKRRVQSLSDQVYAAKDDAEALKRELAEFDAEPAI